MDSSAFLLDLGPRKLEQRFYDLRQINIILHFIAVTQSTLQATKGQRTWDKEAMTNTGGRAFALYCLPGVNADPMGAHPWPRKIC